MSSHSASLPKPLFGVDPKVGRRLRVIVAEDEAVTLEFMRELLDAHYAVETVPDGRAALEAVGRDPLPDLILSDLAMPRLDGLGLLRALRQDPRTARIPVVFITAHDDEATRLMGLEEQVDDFIGKPVRRRELYARVHTALARARARSDSREREERLRAELALVRRGVSTSGVTSPVAVANPNICEQRYLAVAGQAAAGVAWADLEGRITEANQRFCEITGYPEDELIGRPLLELTHPEDRSREDALLARLLAEGWAFDLEKRCVRKNGTFAWVRGGVTPLREEDGRMRSALAVIIDISGTREARQRLSDSEARLSAIFSQRAVGISEITLEGCFLRVNDQLCRMLGRSRTELLASDVSVVTHPEDQPKTLRVFQNLIETGQPCAIDKRYLHADGTVVWASSSLTLLADGWGKPRGVLAVTLDVTARVLAERALRGVA